MHLRWSLGEDDDICLALRVQGQLRRMQPCCLCLELCKVYPFGFQFYPLCDLCCVAHGVNAFSLNHSTVVELPRQETFHALLAMMAPNVTPINQTSFVLPLYNRTHDTCVACGCGDNSIAHWTRFCIVPLIVASYFVYDSASFHNMAQIAAIGHNHLVVASIVIHQFRRLLIERCGMHHNVDGRTSVQWSVSNWINTLGQQSHQALPAHVVKRAWPSFSSSSSESSQCALHSAGILMVQSDPLHITSITRADHLAVSGSTYEKDAILGVLPAGHRILKLLHAQKSSAPANVCIHVSNCECATPHFVVQSTGAVVTNDILNLGSSGAANEYPYILGQFDGGCHSSLSIAGAGYCIYLVYPDAVKLIKWNSIALPDCSDNVVAEVSSCRFLVHEIVSLCRGQLQELRLMEKPVFIQGDILPVIKYLSFAGRLRRNDLLEDLEYILSLSSRWLPLVKWRALPREANELADDLAGQAATFLLERYLSSHPVTSAVSIKAHLPFSKLIQRGAEVSAIPSSIVTPCVTFCERPTIDWLLLERLAQYAPTHVNCAQNYVSRVISNGGAVLVDYTRSEDQLGRCYCVQMGAQRLSRLFRLALFGFNHGEIDLNGAFYELVRRFHLQLPAPHPQLTSIHELRQHLHDFYGGWPNACVNGLVKRLPLRVMNSSVSASLRWIESIGLPPPPHVVLHALRLLETHTQDLVQALSPQVRPFLDVGGRDAVFRILEVVESEIMKRIVSALCSRGLIQSAVWLHDGIWCFPIPPTDVVMGCAKEALEHFGLFSERSFLKIEPLRPKYMDLCSLLSNFSAPITKHFTSLRRAFASSGTLHTAMFGRKCHLTRRHGRGTYDKRKSKQPRSTRGFASRVLKFSLKRNR